LTARREATLIRANNHLPFQIRGAIGNVYFDLAHFESLGLPKSDEGWIGSGPGRYQLFDKGIIVYDGVKDIAYARIFGDPKYAEGRRCRSIVAFFDLRGFTQWSAKTDPDEVQNRLENLEILYQRELKRIWGRPIFIKSNGDGLMVVYDPDGLDRPEFGCEPDPSRGLEEYFPLFFLTCASLVSEAQEMLPHGLKIGCGIDCGEITQVFMFGQWDYIGKALNRAAKLQHEACNEIYISEDFYKSFKEHDSKAAGRFKKVGSPANEQAGNCFKCDLGDIKDVFEEYFSRI